MIGVFFNVGFTGCEEGMTDLQKFELIRLLRSFKQVNEFHHGDCIGSDQQADDIVASNSLAETIHVHAPTNPKKRAFVVINGPKFPRTMYTAREYMDRDMDIVRGSDLLIATPKEYGEVVRSGTWATVRMARKLGKDVYLIFPKGQLVKEEAQ